jgi:hypothetical protein
MTEHKIRRVDYFYVTVRDEPGQAYQMLEQMAGLGINLLAFAAAPRARIRRSLHFSLKTLSSYRVWRRNQA